MNPTPLSARYLAALAALLGCLLLAAPTPALAQAPPPSVEAQDEDDGGFTFLTLWGQLHGGGLTGSADRFEEGSQGFFGFAAGLSITVIDLFIDVRMDAFSVEEAGMWNQVGLGFSFGIELGSIVELILGGRVGYLYAQFTPQARAVYEEKLDNGDRSEEPSQKGINISAPIQLDIELVWPLYLNLTADLGYHILLPDLENAHGVNFSGIGGLKLKFEL